MNTKIWLAIFALCILFACSKNTYNTKPTIKIKSISGNFFGFGQGLNMELEVTDKEGDVTDSLYIRKVRVNKRITETLKGRDTLRFKIPDAPNASDGIVAVSLDYNNHLVTARTPIENDSIIFKIALKDKARNVSDTITSELIVVQRVP
jgi:hypothetical protein